MTRRLDVTIDTIVLPAPRAPVDAAALRARLERRLAEAIGALASSSPPVTPEAVRAAIASALRPEAGGDG